MFRKFYFIYSVLIFIVIMAACQEETERKEKTYVGSVNSNIFQQADCRWAKRINISNIITFEDVEDAKSSGYRACKVCEPPRN